MTDQEIEDLLIRLASRKVAQFQNQEPGYKPPDGLPAGIEGRISHLVWFVGAKHSRAELIAQGATEDQADAALAALKAMLGIIEPSDIAAIPPELAKAIEKDLREAIEEEPEDGPQRLDERVIQEITEYRVEIYSNESQHRGRPHVAVFLPDGKVSISLDDPPEMLTDNGYRHQSKALKVVNKHRVRLLEIWHETRPDDQKLPKPPGAS